MRSQILNSLPATMSVPALPANYTPPASTSKLTPLVSKPAGTLLAAGPAYLGHIRLLRQHGGDFHVLDAATRQREEAAALNNTNGNGEDNDLGVGDEKEDAELLALDPKEWKKQDNYKVLGLSHLRYKATPEQIKIAHRKKVLRHHPDKKAQDHTASSLGINVNTNDDGFFKCVQKAHEVLTNAERRRQFDSVDPQFLEEIEDYPTEKDFKARFFFSVVGDAWLKIRAVQNSAVFAYPVLGLAVPKEGGATKDPNDIEGHEFPEVKNHVEAFYDFWYNFDSWRSFEWLDKEVNEGSDARDDKRYTEKKNKAERARRKKDDIARVRGIVDLCMSVDPRIKWIKQKEKEAREAKKAGGKKPNANAAAAAAAEAAKKAEEEAQKKKEEDEAAAKAEAKKAKAAAANAAKKARRAARAAEEGAA
ncbi:1-cys peroxiredoxin [Mycena kentingensis (nom. inval.)]|nr:1-cys peroxiredoxin [Mycena kentingensis (nom. inval.)]